MDDTWGFWLTLSDSETPPRTRRPMIHSFYRDSWGNWSYVLCRKCWFLKHLAALLEQFADVQEEARVLQRVLRNQDQSLIPGPPLDEQGYRIPRITPQPTQPSSQQPNTVMGQPLRLVGNPSRWVPVMQTLQTPRPAQQPVPPHFSANAIHPVLLASPGAALAADRLMASTQEWTRMAQQRMQNLPSLAFPDAAGWHATQQMAPSLQQIQRTVQHQLPTISAQQLAQHNQTDVEWVAHGAGYVSYNDDLLWRWRGIAFNTDGLPR